ncbi:MULTISPECIES: thioredoxin [Actinomycetaceae]|uniref:thioredoxin n=1 Tax=Actinomycetaceae TaxID=2049 RepID=UPI0008A5106A|nr:MULTISPECIES: thioredoxin [Actinomycetaceae]MBS5826860.1 thioredoxin [Actinomyces sp.]MDP9835222.1 thioredoxin 1 [Gleimia europaea]MDU5231085.1 thioredoxin [Actinomyces sp.]MDU6756587.1 thioredoxin [Actinomyces sp.]OFR33198.1 thiol reductase thioredoxin [Actinomyces sp. HMSC065F11]
MATVDVDFEKFGKTIEENDIVLVDFWAAWCGPCRMFGPIYEEASNRHEDVVFAKVDTEAEQQLAVAAQIQSIPTLMAFREGIAVFRHSGVLQGEALDDIIRQIKELDMDEVRKQIQQADGEGTEGN